MTERDLGQQTGTMHEGAQSEQLQTLRAVIVRARLTGEAKILNSQTTVGMELRRDQQALIDAGGSVIVDTAGNVINYRGVYELPQ